MKYDQLLQREDIFFNIANYKALAIAKIPSLIMAIVYQKNDHTVIDLAPISGHSTKQLF